MGGRSSNFKVGSNGEIYTTTKFMPLLPDEEDIKTQEASVLIDYIDRNAYNRVCKSTDEFKKENFEPNIDKVDQINMKFKQIAEHLSKDTPLKIRGAEFKGNTVACFSYKPFDENGNFKPKQNMNIFLNANLKTKSKSEIENNASIQVKSNFWSPCDNDELINQTLAHEYGHFIQRLINDKKIANDGHFKDIKTATPNEILQYDVDLARKAQKNILQIQKDKFNVTDNFISRYGNTNSQEFFAETFANLMTSDNPTTLAKSLEIYIKENI